MAKTCTSKASLLMRLFVPGLLGRKNFYGSGCECSAELAAQMYSLMATLKLWKINARTWLGAFLQACADNGNSSPSCLLPFLPWAMDVNRLAAMRDCPITITEDLNSS
jgi:transposase